MPIEVKARRAGAAAIVLLLHAAALLGLLLALKPQLLEQRQGGREIVISLPVAPRIERRRPSSLNVPAPEFLRPQILPPRAITLPPVIPQRQAPAEQPGDIRALGRYLSNCSGAYYESLSPREKAHCLANKWNGQEGPTLTLGPAKPSPYDAVIAKRNSSARPVERPCPAGKPTSNLGLPCLNFGDDRQPFVEFRR